MDNTAENPYKAPEAEVVSDSGTGSLSDIFPRFSAWGVFGLSIITLGIYIPYWLHTRSKQITSYVSNPTSQGLLIAMWVLFILNLSSNVVVRIEPAIGAVFAFASLPYMVIYYICAYKLRSQIHERLGVHKGDRLWIGPILTFFFSTLYMQYKINQAIDQER